MALNLAAVYFQIDLLPFIVLSLCPLFEIIISRTSGAVAGHFTLDGLFYYSLLSLLVDGRHSVRLQ